MQSLPSEFRSLLHFFTLADPRPRPQLELNLVARAAEYMAEKSVPKNAKQRLQSTFDYIFQQVTLMSVLSDKTFRHVSTAWWERTTQVCVVPSSHLDQWIFDFRLISYIRSDSISI